MSLDDSIPTRESEFIDIEPHSLDLKWREESIIDPLGEGVFIDGLTEIVIRIDIIIALRSSSESEVYRSGEIPQYFCPVPIFSCSSTMTLIDDDEIEKVRIISVIVGFEYFIRTLFTCTSDECLIDREKYIGIGRDDSSFFLDEFTIDLEDIFFERIEGIHRLIYEDIAISEDEDTWSTLPNTTTRPASHEELVCDLECYHGLSCTCCEGEKYTFLIICYGFHHSRYRDFLIVPRSFARDIVWFFLEDFASMIGFSESSLVEFFWVWVFLDIIPCSTFEIEFVDFLTIGRIEVSHSEDFPIFLHLFESLRRMEMISFGFDDREIHPVIP